jgi:hypothetical protein
MQTLKEITKRFFDLDLPISGGFGNSIEIPLNYWVFGKQCTIQILNPSNSRGLENKRV